jgi:pSer/pThr/pTyr-binding forkhead associated (FHA) protein
MPVITIGRDPTSVVRFDLADDLEVSTRHAEITEDDEGVYSITDKGSTNGTWVNGARVRGARRIYPGDLIQLGRSGPKLRVIAIEDERWTRTVENKVKLPPLNADTGSRRQHTREFMITMVETRTRSFRFAVFAILGVVAALGIGGWLYGRSINTEDPQLWSDVTAPSIRLANDAAVVLIESQVPGQRCAGGCEGTGFSISPAGLIVTNRHVVMQGGTMASSIRVKFANTSAWVPATFVAAAQQPAIDVALIQVSKTGSYPSVVGLSESGPDLAIGSSVLTIGFPLGTLLRMEGKGATEIAKTTVTTGSIGKMLPTVFQIDAFADHGSSGSPVFDRHGHVIGLVASGIEDPSANIVYVVPSDRVAALRKTK